MNRIVANLLVDAGYSNVYTEDPPKTLSNYILVSDSGGFGLSTEDAGFGRPTVQIIVANKNSKQLNYVLKQITVYLLKLKKDDISSVITEYDWDDPPDWQSWQEWGETDNTQGFDLLSDPITLGRDEDLRYLQSINFIVLYNYI